MAFFLAALGACGKTLRSYPMATDARAFVILLSLPQGPLSEAESDAYQARNLRWIQRLDRLAS
jgi:hypothetical protein